MLSVFASLLSCIALGIVWFIYTRPIVSTFNLLVIVALLYYVILEKSPLHDAAEFENRFWTAIACVTAFNNLFAPDSIFAYGKTYPFECFVVCVCFTLFAHMYDRKVHRNDLAKSTRLKRTPTINLTNQDVAKMKVGIIESSMKELDNPFWPSAIEHILSNKVTRSQQAILDTLIGADSEQLAYIVTNIK